jgi:hypothetical protein
MEGVSPSGSGTDSRMGSNKEFLLFGWHDWSTGRGSSRDGGIDISKVALSKLSDRFHDIRQCAPFLGQRILDSRRNLQESVSLDKPNFFEHLEPLRYGLGADIAYCLQNLAKAFGASHEGVDDQEGTEIAKQPKSTAYRMSRTGRFQIRGE